MSSVCPDRCAHFGHCFFSPSSNYWGWFYSRSWMGLLIFRSTCSTGSLVRHSHCRFHSTDQKGSLASLGTLCGVLSRKTKCCNSKYVKANFLFCPFSSLWSRSFIFYYSVPPWRQDQAGPLGTGHADLSLLPILSLAEFWVCYFQRASLHAAVTAPSVTSSTVATLPHQPLQTSPVHLHLEVGTCLSSSLELAMWCFWFLS